MYVGLCEVPLIVGVFFSLIAYTAQPNHCREKKDKSYSVARLRKHVATETSDLPEAEAKSLERLPGVSAVAIQISITRRVLQLRRRVV